MAEEKKESNEAVDAVIEIILDLISAIMTNQRLNWKEIFSKESSVIQSTKITMITKANDRAKTIDKKDMIAKIKETIAEDSSTEEQEASIKTAVHMMITISLIIKGHQEIKTTIEVMAKTNKTEGAKTKDSKTISLKLIKSSAMKMAATKLKLELPTEMAETNRLKTKGK